MEPCKKTKTFALTDLYQPISQVRGTDKLLWNWVFTLES